MESLPDIPIAKRCPSCGLPSRINAERCVCGYSFISPSQTVNRATPGPVVHWTLIVLVAVVLTGIGAAIVIPLLRATGYSDEAGAIGGLRSINSSESTYSSSCGGDGYAQSLEDLAKPPVGGSTVGFVESDLAKNGVIKRGYVFTLRPDASAVTVTPASKTCNGARADAVSSYFAEAHPVKIGGTSNRSFATDARGTIYFNNTGAVIQPGMEGASVLQ